MSGQESPPTVIQKMADMIAGISQEKRKPGSAFYGALCRLAAEVGAKMDAAIHEDHEPWDHSASNWASEIGHPCLLNLVLKRTRWKEERRMDLDGEWRVKEGQDQEKRTKALLDEIGFTLVKAQARVTLEEFKITGKIDGMIETPDRWRKTFSGIRELPVEIKSINPIYWATTRTIWEVKNHPKFWIRKHASQLNFYFAGHKLPGGLLILKTFGQRPRIMPMMLDQDLLDHDTGRAAQVNRHVEAKTLPAPIPYEDDACEMCGFNHICKPLHASKFSPVERSETVELELFLELQEIFKKAKGDFEEIKKKLIGDEEKPGRYFGKNGLVLDIEIKTQEQNRKECKIPEKEKEQIDLQIEEILDPYTKRKKLPITTIKRTGPKKKEGAG